MNNWQPIENIPLDTRVLLSLNGYVYIGECLSKFPTRYAYDHRPIAVFEYTNNNGPAAWQNLPEVSVLCNHSTETMGSTNAYKCPWCGFIQILDSSD